jgi:hypothetical protein
MDIVSLCPLRVGGFTWQAHTGTYARTVIVKATFRLEPGLAVLAPEQEPVHDRERTWDDDPKRSVRVPSDRAPYKARADVTLVGHAYAPYRQPVRSFVARMIIGEIDKSIEVWCDRGFRIHDNQLLEGRRFVTMPLMWERAAGGPATINPIGMRFDAAPDQYGMVAIPNLQPVRMYVSQRPDTIAPVCFGPIGSTWPPRMQKLGRRAGGFRDPGWEQSALPADFDSGYFQAAPPDQQIAEIQPNERIVLENLHPEQARLVTALPGIRPRAIVDRATGEREEVQLVGDTLWIDTDRGICCVVWRGRIGLRHAAEAGRIAVWVDGMPMVVPAEVHASKSDSSVADEDADIATATLVGPLAMNVGSTLPFVPGSSKFAASHQGIAADIARWAAGAMGDGTGTVLAPIMQEPPENTLPFRSEVGDRKDVGEATLPIRQAGVAPPFIPVAPPLLQPMRSEGGSSFKEDSFGFAEPAAAKPMEIKSEAPEQALPDVAPPPMIGPLAKAEAEASESVAPVMIAPPARPLEPGAENNGTIEVAVDGIELSIEETATIAAELLEGQVERAKVLEAHALSERAWSANEVRWNAAMEEEQDRGRDALRRAYDAAYVRRVEEYRGTIVVEECARILVGMERGKAEAVLAELRIQGNALMPIVRLWSKKIGRDMKLGREAMAALQGVREM